jgi:hypothetical protein
MEMRGWAAAVVGSLISVTALIAQDALTALGVRPDQAKVTLFEVLGTGRLYQEAAKIAFLKASAEARVALVNGALTWAKEYTESPEFAKRYASARTAAEPRLSMGRKWTAEEELTRRQTLLDQRIATEKKRLEGPPSPGRTPEQQQAERKRSEERITGMETERARYDDPIARAELRKPLEAEDQRVNDEHARWEEAYPADFRAAVGKRLREFLALSATVDFGAKLVPCKDASPPLSCFADPTYEKQTPAWKRCYRAGKQPVEAARTFAANWLRELEQR